MLLAQRVVFLFSTKMHHVCMFLWFGGEVGHIFFLVVVVSVCERGGAWIIISIMKCVIYHIIIHYLQTYGKQFVSNCLEIYSKQNYNSYYGIHKQ